MKRNKTAKEQKFADDAKLLRMWKRWHAERLEEVLTGPHAAIATSIVTFLKTMTPASANALLALMRSRVWADVDIDTRFVLLHEINTAITAIREKNNMEVIDDALPGQRLTAFQTIKAILFP